MNRLHILLITLSAAAALSALAFLIHFFLSRHDTVITEKGLAPLPKKDLYSFARPLPAHPKQFDSTLVDVRSIDSTLLVGLVYSTPDNFMKQDVYGDLERAFLRKEIALKLKTAQAYMKAECPCCRLLILDAARPLSVQRKMWDVVKGTPMKQYVAYPGNHSNHNYGAAVDVTVFDRCKGKELDMGTHFDCFTEMAWPLNEAKLLAEGKLTEEQVNNRRLLRSCMRKAGFGYSVHEWWHFNGMRDSLIRATYSVIQ